jgi:predicted enzyme related to lactoylglutathione lyase
MKIGLTNVYVDDPIKAFTFYTQVLGFVERLYVPEAMLAIVASAEAPDGTGLLLEPNNNPIAQTYQQALYQAGLPAIAFTTQDIHQEQAWLQARGVVFTQQPTTTEWGILALFDDTCGNLIQLHQL